MRTVVVKLASRFYAAVLEVLMSMPGDLQRMRRWGHGGVEVDEAAVKGRP
jgi:hypothetical protein